MVGDSDRYCRCRAGDIRGTGSEAILGRRSHFCLPSEPQNGGWINRERQRNLIAALTGIAAGNCFLALMRRQFVPAANTALRLRLGKAGCRPLRPFQPRSAPSVGGEDRWRDTPVQLL
jgi:hypothetical protein